MFLYLKRALFWLLFMMFKLSKKFARPRGTILIYDVRLTSFSRVLLEWMRRRFPPSRRP